MHFISPIYAQNKRNKIKIPSSVSIVLLGSKLRRWNKQENKNGKNMGES